MAVEWRLAPGGRRRGTARRRGTGRAARVPRAGPGRGGRAGRTGGVGCGTPEAANTKHGTRDYLTAVRLYFIREWIRPLAPLRMKVQVLVQV